MTEHRAHRVAPGRTDWRYRYSASGEREQKRQYYTPNGDNGGNGYRWTYYLLGGKKEQLSVWEGYQTRDWLCGEQPNQWGYVYLWGKEYLSYGVGGTASVVSKPTGETEYRIADHLGSVRVSYNDVTMQTTPVDYAPFGNILPQGGAVAGLPRQEFIDRERDKESGLGNFGVRQYEYETGRFLGVDPLWESFTEFSPYHYSVNNPLMFRDTSGKILEFQTHEAESFFWEAIDYLLSADAPYAWIFQALQDDPDHVYVIVIDKSDLDFNRTRDLVGGGYTEIRWNPFAATEYVNSQGKVERYSPAISLLHELGHGWLQSLDVSYPGRRPNYDEFLKSQRDEFEEFVDMSEWFVINNIEAEAAKAMGEIEEGRSGWGGIDKYHTNSPTSTEPRK